MSYVQRRSVKKCEDCKKPMVLRCNRQTNGFFLGCLGYPECKSTQAISVSDLVNYLLLTKEYLLELLEMITTNEAIERGDWQAIQDLKLLAREAQEHVESEGKKVRQNA